jgi:diguanylate cyclase (GGDEF)-like protein
MSVERPASGHDDPGDQARDGRDPRLWALLQASRAITSSHNLVQSVGTVKFVIAGLFDGSGCRVDVHLLQDDGTFVCVLPDAGDSPGEALDVLERSSPDKVVREAFDARAPVQPETRVGGRARLVLPVVFKGRALGCIDVSRDLGQRFSDDEVELLQVLTNQAAAAVENARLARTLERQADNDPLTGLHTRRFFYDRLMSEATRVRRYRGDLSVVIVDLDDFGEFNKAHGRRAGDRVLRGVGRLVQGCVRRWVDTASRLDGQEFGLLLPQTSSRGPGVQVVAERVRRAIEEALLRDESDEFIGTVTVSLGVAGLPADVEDPDDLLRAAREALKAAKAAGKNRVALYRDTR